MSMCLPVPPVRLGIMPLPGLPTSRGRLVEAVPFAQAAGFLAGRCEAAGFAVLHKHIEY